MFSPTPLLAIAVGLCVSAIADEAKRDAHPRLELAQSPVPPFRPRPAVADKGARIKKLIAQLADVDRPDIGYSQTIGGLAFAPVPDHASGLTLTFTNHGLGSSQPFRELVGLGPDALPFLLDALGDKTPTKLTFKHCGSSDIIREGKTWFSNELPSGNGLNPREARVFNPPREVPKEGEHVETYRVRVGDLCFAAIGQIVGRPYLAARYQMTSCTVINSPVEDAKLRERVRRIWVSDDAAHTLYDSLWTDYRTTGVPRGPDLEEWNSGSQFQAIATLRLLHYFPEESAPVIAARLKKLNVAKAAPGTRAFNQQGVANGGVYADEFVHEAAWCKVPEVREAVRGVFRRTTDVGVFAAALAAFDDTEAARIVKKADDLLEGLTADERKDGAQYYLLGVLAARTGAASAPTFRRLMAKAAPTDLAALAGALESAKGDWPVALLKPLLDDPRPTDRTYSVYDKGKAPVPITPGGDDGSRKVPVRVCDATAEVLAGLLPREPFPTEHDRATLDRYIAKLKEKLATK